MWKDRHPTPEHDMTKAANEMALDKRDKSIRALLDDLVSGTRELRSLYTGDNGATQKEPT